MTVTYAKVGSGWTTPTTFVGGPTTLAVDPVNVGDILLVEVNANCYPGSPIESCVLSGGGVTEWSLLKQQGGTDSTNAAVQVQIFWGVVTTAGPATLTVTFGTYYFLDIIAQEFEASEVGTWSADTVSGATGNGGSETGGTFPSIAPTADGAIFAGATGNALAASSYTAITGGFGSLQAGDVQCGLLLWNLDSAGAQAPEFTVANNGKTVMVDGFVFLTPSGPPPATSGMLLAM
jgi:hypothetical protein